MSASCNRCGETWDRDPALEVDCPTCSAEVGQKCRRPSGWEAPIHHDRDRLALQQVEGYEQCPVAVEAPDQQSTGARVEQGVLL